MAEVAVNFALETLNSFLVEEIKLLGSAKQEVESIKRELESIRSFLKDADTRAAAEEEGESNEGVLTWVKQVREEAYRIEDVIDEYIMEAAKLPHGSGLIRFLHKMCCFISELKLRHEIATEIDDIKSSLSEIQQRGQRYGFKSKDQGSSSGTRNAIPHDSRVGSFFIEDSEVVGIESTRDELIGWLVDERPKRSVLAVVGQGGLGKTTLVGKVFKNEAIKRHFDCLAWITVGKEYIKNNLLRTIIREFYRLTGSIPVEIDKMEEKDLISTLREYLKDKCYIVVFDDIWKIQFWEDIEHSLLNNNRSSRIILTTRNKGVADFIPFVNVCMLKPLPSDKAWELFCRKAFDSEVCCPPELEKLSHDILAKCGGLPLAIVAVGGLLSNKKKVVAEWQKLLDSLGSKLGSDPHLKSCNRILSEGYYDLPHHLKSCLLYFGLFPESYSISCRRLIRMWLAEGFIQYSRYPSSEQVAEEYLAELIDRSLVQVSERDFSGRVRSCRVHDLMHEIILKKTKELGFCRVLNKEYLSQCSVTRRISMNRTANVLNSIEKSKIRSICIFNVKNLPKSFVSTFVADFKLIKVLDFQDAPVDYLPDGVGQLFHLHYLSLKNTRVKELPKSIGKLLNLETLNLRWSCVGYLPIEIKNLKKLCYLLVRCRLDRNVPYGRAVTIHEGFGALTDLQQLGFVQANSEEFKELRKLRQLRKLSIRLANRNVKDMFAIVENMENLEYLGVVLASGDEILDIQSFASPPQCLQHFYLKGNIMKLPDWISELQNLIRIHLFLTGPTDDIIRVLKALPNLLLLNLEVTCCDEQLHFKEGWFPKLQELALLDFKELKLMTIEEGAMPNLREMVIGPCPLLKEIPNGIEHLRNLETLRFFKMLNETYHMIKNENWEKATKHIPKVGVNYKHINRTCFYYTAKYLSSLSPEDIEQLVAEDSGWPK